MRNENQHSADYENLRHLYRPSHADFTYATKYGLRDHRGGGRTSARETIARCVGGAMAKLALRHYGIRVTAYTSQVGPIALTGGPDDYDLAEAERNPVRCPDPDVAEQMAHLIAEVKAEGDTIGGIITGVITGCPVGLGQPVFGKLHAALGAAMLSINAVKGFEYGEGFAGVTARGSEQNDVFVPDGKGGYRLISGNEMGVILLDFICRSRIANGTMTENPVAVTTIVSTDMVTAVANKYGVELRRVLTGFKYIGEQIALLEAGGHPERYIFGFEESYGYLSGPHVRDKDAVNAVLLICEAAAWYAKKGMTLGDAIDALYAEFGCFCNAQKSFTFAGETGMEKMASLMSGLRTHPLQSVAGLPVEGFTDYEQEGTGLPKANVLEYRLPGGAKLIIRPSGTEPKIKAYLSAVKPTVEEATRQLDSLAAAAAELLA